MSIVLEATCWRLWSLPSVTRPPIGSPAPRGSRRIALVPLLSSLSSLVTRACSSRRFRAGTDCERAPPLPPPRRSFPLPSRPCPLQWPPSPWTTSSSGRPLTARPQASLRALPRCWRRSSSSASVVSLVAPSGPTSLLLLLLSLPLEFPSERAKHYIVSE